MPPPTLGPDTLGSLAWLRHTEGRLTLRERLSLMQAALGPRFVGDLVAARWARPSPQAPQQLAPLLARLPDTPAVGRALQAMAETGHTDLLQHSWRTHWWATAFAHAEGRAADVDMELLLVASLMHDLGLASPSAHAATGCACFTGHSALAAVALATEAGWTPARAQAVGDAITLHMNGHVAPEQGLEAHFMQRATATDVIGAQLAKLPARWRQDVLSRHPRGDFDSGFTQALRDQARRHPQSRSALMRQLGVGWLIRFNPY
ncbi:MAG: hypothetical protein RI907_3269 [Pseudomonadota bacterium]|jgi:hypothetical protein